MGLPMFREPEEIEAQQTIEKVERAAATSRSTIRRESTVRPRRYHTSALLNRNTGNDDRPPNALVSDANDEYRNLEAEIERRRRDRMHFSRPAQAPPRATRPRRGGEIFHYHRPDGTLASRVISIDNNRSLREIRLEQEALIRQEAVRLRTASRRSFSPRRNRASASAIMPSPPHSLDSEGRLRDTPDGPLRIPEDGPAEPRSNFAPAHDSYHPTPQPSEGMSRIIIEHGTYDDVPALETPPPETSQEFHPLRRVGHLSPRPTASTHDGLGDRLRSPTPESPFSVGSSSAGGQDRWETLLTTMDDTDLRPSNQSSFSSIRSTSQPGSNNWSQSTATSFGEIGQIDDTCDLDLPQGITAEDARQIRERHRGTGSTTQPTIGEVNRRSEQRPNSISGERATIEMARLQDLLGRLTRSEAFDDEWWAAAGLARTVRENV